MVLKNQTFANINFNEEKKLDKIINDLKIVYEDYWKNFNQINTSIKLVLNIKVSSSNNLRISDFEKTLDSTDLIYKYYIFKFDKDYIFYQITFNGTPNNFLKTLSDNDFNIDTQNKMWILK